MATLYANKDHFDALKVLAAAEYAGTKLTVKDEAAPSDKFFGPARPAFVDGEKTLQGAIPISWQVSAGKLRGGKGEESDVLCWVNFAESTLRPALMAWVLPATSCMAHCETSHKAAQNDSLRLLGALNDVLVSKTFLVGERLSLADIHTAFTLLPAYQYVIEPATTQKFANLTRWFMTVMNQPEVLKVAGKVTLCEKAHVFNAATFSANAAKIAPVAAKKDKKEKKPKEEKKKAEKKPKAVEPEEEMDEADLAVAAEGKKKDPFADMPKSTFNMDEFKRTYSNEDTEKVAIPYFWDKFDKENYSIWYGEYMYPEDLKMVFMSCNLMGGMMQRLDTMRKNAFGSMCLFGENNNSTIGGLWFWKGQGLAFDLSPDWQIDSASYKWTKLDPNAESTKTMVKEYFTWEGKFDGKKFNQGKIFK